MTLQDVIGKFNTTPFLFAGSGITRRYYGLPDWVGLLSHFAQMVRDDPFAYQYYENQAAVIATHEDRLPRVASCIEKEFNEAWFQNRDGVRSTSDHVSAAVARGVSPFKAEVAEYIRSLSSINACFKDEVQQLRHISVRNISGVITTNYDCFFEDTFSEYRTFIGQDELVFSQLQGVAEIYKIHGSVAAPETIVLNQADYEMFGNKGKYLAAKLMTIFMEYPIVFVGYSISDPDIQTILSDIVACLPADKIPLLRDRFVFVEYDKNCTGSFVASHSMTFSGKVLEMTKVTLSDLGLLYNALALKRAALPVKVLRRFKDELYTFVLTQQPGPTMQVAALEDSRIDENTLALSIGLSSTGVYGLRPAVDSEHWYRNIILHDSEFTCEQLLELTYPSLARQNSWKLPAWYYIAKSNKKCELAEEKACHSYEDIVGVAAIKRNSSAVANRTAAQIWIDERLNRSKAFRLLANMPQYLVNMGEYQEILEAIFKEDPNILSNQQYSDADRSNIRRMIRIYDFLAYGQKKTP